ncbi:tail fiber protein [Pseudomonas guariconensis]|nr:tail fiber protein [Pseudomonas guariconensis]
MRNGREVSEFLSDGQAVTLQQPCDFGESVQILAFSSFQSANTYTKAEVDALLTASAGLPVGTMLPFPKGTVPPGFLEVDGSLQRAAAYPDLAAYLGTTFNTGGEAAGYFRLPESRGEFLRGWDHGRGVDAGRSIGSTQGDAIRNLSGTLGKVYRRADSGEATGVYANSLKSPGQIVTGSNVADQTVEIKFDASLQVPTAAENRPRNLAVMWCIKAWNAPVNQGQVDVAALAPLAAQATEIKLGTARFGTPAEQLAGILKTVMSNPAGVMALLAAWFPKRVFTDNDYIRIPDVPGGLILQWGFANGSAASGTVTYPVAFPVEALGGVLQNHYTTSDSASFTVRNAAVTTNGFKGSKTGFTWDSTNTARTLAFNWLAWGY